MILTALRSSRQAGVCFSIQANFTLFCEEAHRFDVGRKHNVVRNIKRVLCFSRYADGKNTFKSPKIESYHANS